MKKSAVGNLFFPPLLLLILGAVLIFGNRLSPLLPAFAIAALALGFFFLSFERGPGSASMLALLAILTAVSVASRLIFQPIPFVKPVTAVVILTALYFGPQSGFLVGALSALVSNFYMGQGMWTPFQMAAWGFIGMFAGLFAKPLLNSRILLLIYAGISGIVFTLVMEVLTTFWMDGQFNPARYIAYLLAALPMTVMYVLSNMLFVWMLIKPVGRILDRIRLKYGL